MSFRTPTQCSTKSSFDLGEGGRPPADWHDIECWNPGKLFIVGDPKQSIYAFRRADIEVLDRVVEKITADGGMAQTLTTNFRSDAAVLGPVE